MKPYKAIPVLKERIWGGQKLTQYNKSFSGEHMGESWETDKDSMPVLIKLIDAKELLSVQVHPDDGLAWELEQQEKGKTEAWIILECEEGAELVVGMKPGTTRAQLEEAIHSDVKPLLNRIKVKRGDCLYIPAGTVHCLGNGILVYEVQQPSDITYRLYDWDRRDETGKSRELHLEKGLRCIQYHNHLLQIINLYSEGIPAGQFYSLFESSYFNTGYLNLKAEQSYDLRSSCFTTCTLISGKAHINFEDNSSEIYKGDTWIIPKGSFVRLSAVESAEFIITKAPDSLLQ